MNNTKAAFDKRVSCWSVLTSYKVDDYLKLVEQSYRNRGGLEFQRDKLKTTTAKRIRKRMVDDVLEGAVLPPVVIGLVVPSSFFDSIIDDNAYEKLSEALATFPEKLSIIDGMQRTSALIEGSEIDEAAVKDLDVRVEFWIAH